jgi:translation initiation factor 2 subunit 2
MDYKAMLKKGRDELPESVFNAERFEIPKVVGHIEGNKTIISNFHQIAGVLRRTAEHLLKFVLRELATPGDLRQNMLILKAKIPASKINEKIRKYANEFVICSECGKPDTKIIKEGPVSYLKCNACGAKHAVKSKI